MEEDTESKYHMWREIRKRKELEKVHIGDTKFNVTTIMNQHKKDVEFLRRNNAIAKYEHEKNHEINWK